MKKITLLVALAISSLCATAQNFSVTYTFDSVKTTTGTTDPSFVPTATGVTFGSFSSVGASANPNAAGRFSFTGWSIGSTGGFADTLYSGMTGALDAGKYYEVTISPNSGFGVNLDTIRFSARRSPTGPRSYSVRSSVDGFTSNISNAVLPASPWISIQGTNEFFYRHDTTANGLNTINGNFIFLTGGTFSNLSSPVTFRFYFWNAEAAAGSFFIDNVRINGSTISLNPTISSQPQDQIVCVGSTASFSVTASNAVSYQWEEDAGSGFVPLSNTGVYSGVDTDILNISNTSGLSGNNYHCVVTNGSGNTTSNAALLTEAAPVTPSVSLPVTSVTICESDSISGYAIGVNDGANPTYLWYLVGNPSPVGVGQALSIGANIIPPGTYQVYCELTSSIGCVTTPTANSDTLTLTVNPSPAIPVVSEVTNILYTSSYTSYQWYIGTTALGTDSSQVAANSGIYTVEVTNSFGCTAVSPDYNFVYVGISGLSANSNSIIYPNPSADGMFTLDLGNAQANTTVTVYDVLGNVITSKEISVNGKYALNLTSEAKGCYFVSVKNNHETSTHKITITK